MDGLVCWKCGASLAHLPMPVPRVEECADCHADLHACRLCEFYDTRVAKSCREPVAEEVKDKERANFCDYFKPRPGAHVPRDDAEARAARAALDALFGATGDGDAPQAGESPEEHARRRLEDLFRGPGRE